MYLFEEFFQVCSSFVPHPCLWDESAGVVVFVYAYAEVYVFAESHGLEAA